MNCHSKLLEQCQTLHISVFFSTFLLFMREVRKRKPKFVNFIYVYFEVDREKVTKENVSL